MLPALAGANLIYGMGMLEMGQVLSFSQMVMDNEFAAMIKRSIRGIEVNDELMAVDVIKRVGIGGNFLGQQHTMDHLDAEQIPLVDHEGYPEHLQYRFDLAGNRYFDLLALSKASHPLSQRRHGDFPADDDHRDQRDDNARIALHKQHETHGNHELVGDGIEKFSETRRLAEFPRRQPIQPVRYCGEAKDNTGNRSCEIHRTKEAVNDKRDCRNAQPGQDIGQVCLQDSVRFPVLRIRLPGEDHRKFSLQAHD